MKLFCDKKNGLVGKTKKFTIFLLCAMRRIYDAGESDTAGQYISLENFVFPPMLKTIENYQNRNILAFQIKGCFFSKLEVSVITLNISFYAHIFVNIIISR